jgi:diaminopimelate epimerase
VARVHFSKYEGLGNDFVVVEGGAPAIDASIVRRLCDRHFGIGADGVLLVRSAASARPRMIVMNADGSRPEMCGNGLRCVAVHLAEKLGARDLEIVVETDAGPLRCLVEGERVEVDMGQLVAEGSVEIALGVRVHRFVRMSIGNPHAITFDPYADADVDRIGPVVEKSPLFLEGTNVEFARVTDDGGIDLVVWERGVGRTLACGTGACATVGAACLAGKVPWGQFVRVTLPGGSLQVSVAEDTMRATMRGPARKVFEGEVELP